MNGKKKRLSAAAYLRERYTNGHPVELRPGLTVYIRPVSFDTVLALGRVPEPLVSYVSALVAGEIKADPDDSPLMERAEATTQFLDTIVTMALVSPRVVEDPAGEDEIALEWLTLEEKTAISRVLYQPVEDLRPFRRQSQVGMESVPAGENNQHETESAVEAESVG